MNDFAKTIAAEFAAAVKLELSPEEFASVLRRNAHEPRGSTVCHTHDFVDANELMHLAFVSVMKRDPLGDSGMSDDDTALWNESWNLAFRFHLGGHLRQSEEYAEGWRARAASLSVMDCPYRARTPEAKAWRAGWMDASRDPALLQEEMTANWFATRKTGG